MKSSIAVCAFMLLSVFLGGSASVTYASDSVRAFPDAQGWAAFTPGGRGGQIVRVTTLEATGPGSIGEALKTEGPRIVVFEVGGVIDLERQLVTIDEPYLTIAGQTAPPPGITFIRGGFTISTHDVVIRHIRVRPGEAGAAKRSGWEPDGITAWSGHNIIVDQCSLTWAVDENLSASGPRFEGGATSEHWRKGTSHRITFSNNIIAESLSESTHSKGEHSKGSLIHDNTSEILIVGNLYASNMERNPLLKGGAKAVVANNYIVNPGRRALHYSLNRAEWGEHKYEVGELVAVGNVVRAGPSSSPELAFLMMGSAGDLRFFHQDNIASARDGKPLPLIEHFRESGRAIEVKQAPFWPEGFVARPAAAVVSHVIANAGARPWDRDAIDARIVREAEQGGGRIIDSESQGGGYPTHKMTRRAFVPEQWDLKTMMPRDPALVNASRE